MAGEDQGYMAQNQGKEKKYAVRELDHSEPIEQKEVVPKSTQAGGAGELDSKGHASPFFYVLLATAVVFVLLVAASFGYFRIPGQPFQVGHPNVQLPLFQDGGSSELVQSESDEEFLTYVASGGELVDGYGVAGGLARVEMMALDTAAVAPVEGGVGLAPMAERVSQTNVQVAGIDEPDVVKTDGSEIYVSGQGYFARPLIEPVLLEGEGMASEGLITPDYRQPETRVVKAFPPGEMDEISRIEENGEMLLYGDTLVVFMGNRLVAYDVSEASSPGEKWSLELESNQERLAARLSEDKIYLVTRTYAGGGLPCPVPLLAGDERVKVMCTDIYHPSQVAPVDATFSVLAVDGLSGQVEKTVSFLGSQSQSVVYVSPENVYITYGLSEDVIEFLYGFYTNEGSGLVSRSVVEQLDNLRGLTISSRAKMVELEVILERYYASLASDERARVENEVANKLSGYLAGRGRDLEKTGIVKVGLGDLEVRAQGEVPGSPLNQFALDEYEGNLRIATNVSGSVMGFRAESANDVYVLDGRLDKLGEVTDLGVGERIYGVRFMGDRGYVVTFRQMDPFYVLDLTNPQVPEMKGELKIPGYSSYLHQVAPNQVLGVGREESRVKLALYDVSNPAEPTETAKYNLDEFWTEVEGNHHAFLHDPEHEVFFMPGGKGGYVFSYSGGDLTLERVVGDMATLRAVFIDDYLYVVGSDRIVVLDERDWQEVNELVY